MKDHIKRRFSTSGKEVSSDDSAGASRPGMITTSSLGPPLVILGSVAPRQGRAPLGEPATLLCLEKGQGKFSFTHPHPLSHHQTRDYAGTLRVLQTRSSDTPCPGSGTHSNATIVPTSSAPVRAGRRPKKHLAISFVGKEEFHNNKSSFTQITVISNAKSTARYQFGT